MAHRFNYLSLILLTVGLGLDSITAFSPSSSSHFRHPSRQDTIVLRSSNPDDAWNGNVVSNQAEGKIQGCSIQLVEGSLVDWTVTIDGEQADLGRFSQAIYKKILGDAKQQRFQGFRPGTIPPQLEPTYRAFAMDECARETVLEALQQNNIRPFDSCRQDILIENVCIPAPVEKNKKKKKKKTKSVAEPEEESTPEPSEQEIVVSPWRTYATMKEAIDAGWRPGQSFSFVASKIKGQKVADGGTSGSDAIDALSSVMTER